MVRRGGRLDFGALLSRMSTSPRSARRLAAEQPASFVAFDVLAVAGHDVRGQPLRARRELLEELGLSMAPPLQLSPTTADVDVARQWFTDLVVAGVEGVMVKGAGQPYRPGMRDWLKVKHRRTIEVVCAAVTGSMRQPETLVAGLPIGGELRIVGRTSPLRPEQRRALAGVLRPPAGEHPWPAEVPRSFLDRFSKERGPIKLARVEPFVMEVSADTAWSGSSFRHPLRFLRHRPDLGVGDVRAPEGGP